METASSACPKCALPVLANFYFCPNCGKALRDKPIPMTVGKQIGLYLFSVLLPPLGVIPGIKYMLQSDSKTKIVGFVMLLLTVLSLIISINLFSSLMNQLNKQLIQSGATMELQVPGL